MQNGYPKAPSGGLQQNYPGNGAAADHQTKCLSWAPLQTLEKVSQPDQPGTEPCQNGPCLKEEDQIMAEGFVPLGAQEQDREKTKEYEMHRREKLALFLALCKATKSFLFLSLPVS